MYIDQGAASLAVMGVAEQGWWPGTQLGLTGVQLLLYTRVAATREWLHIWISD